ncbi:MULTISPECIES: hypothetical protein [Paraburkholderia]|uniref:hypothetical protein n=1 Tax=Paraburkholderia TaxID=1822464 RepID=UPI0004A7F80C
MYTQAAEKHFNFDHLTHVTLATGHTGAAHSDSVSTEVRAYFAPLIATALASGEPVAVPLVAPNAFMTICKEDGAYRTCLLARDGGALVPVVTFGISLAPPQGALLWQRLNSELLLASANSARPPKSPWIAVRLELAALRHIGVVAAAGEFERSIAWTLATHIVQTQAQSPPANDLHATATSGQPMAERPSVPASDGCVFDCQNGGGPTLTVYFSSPSDEEICDIRRGEARFAIAKHRDTIFILAKFGKLDWMDAPFHAGLYPAESRGMPAEWHPGARLGLAVRIVDRNTGLQRGARLLSLSPHFWDTLAAQVNRQDGLPISRSEYDVAISVAYGAYPTPRAMLKHALATSKAGD